MPIARTALSASIGLLLALFVPAAAGAVTVGAVAPAPATTQGGCDAATCAALVQDTVAAGGPSYSIPFDGVATSIALRTGDMGLIGADTVRFYTFRSSPSSYVAYSDTGPINFPVDGTHGIVTLPIRETVTQGSLLGMGLGHFTNTADDFNSGTLDPLDNVDGFNSPPQLGVYEGADSDGSPFRLNLRVTVEPDVDHDGYGDETQDLCVTDPAVQTLCPVGGPGSIDNAPPVITQFKTLFKRFRVKPKGAVVSKRAHPGTTISLNLSEDASVVFTVEKAFRGKITNGVCQKAGRKNRKNRRCTKYVFVHSFTRALTTGVNALPYSARYPSNGKIGTLRPGPYRMTAVATDVAGNVSVPDTIAFKVRR